MPDYGTLKLPFEITSSVPKPPPAAVLPALGTAGVVMLFEPGHPLSGKSGVPSTGENFNDIAEDWTALTLGAASGGLAVTNTIPAVSSWGFVERTAKGGLHEANAQADAGTPYQNFSIGFGAPRRTYLDARVAAGDQFYISTWERVTRGPKDYASGAPSASIRRSFSALGDYYAAVGTASGAPWVWPQSGSRYVNSTTLQSGNAQFTALAAKDALTGAFSTANNVVVLGPRDANTLNKLPSIVLYRVYIENLTASGRTYAQVEAADKAEFNAQVLTATGRYFGDSWRSPLSIK